MRDRDRRRSGITLLEIQVALVVLGVGLAGIAPILVMQSRLIRKFESTSLGDDNPQVVRGVRLVNGSVYVTESGAQGEPVAVIQPQPDAWVRRLGLPASFATAKTSQTYTATLTERTIDDGDAAFTGTWADAEAADAHGGAVKTLPKAGAGTATWTFSDITPGRYRVRISWNATVAMDGDAAFVIDGNLPGVKVKDAPLSDDGLWRDLGAFDLGTSAQVQLSGSDGGPVFADAVQIGPRNAVVIRPALDTDAPAADGGMAVRVQIGAKP